MWPFLVRFLILFKKFKVAKISYHLNDLEGKNVDPYMKN